MFNNWTFRKYSCSHNSNAKNPQHKFNVKGSSEDKTKRQMNLHRGRLECLFISIRALKRQVLFTFVLWRHFEANWMKPVNRTDFSERVLPVTVQEHSRCFILSVLLTYLLRWECVDQIYRCAFVTWLISGPKSRSHFVDVCVRLPLKWSQCQETKCFFVFLCSDSTVQRF